MVYFYWVTEVINFLCKGRFLEDLSFSYVELKRFPQSV